MPILTPDTSSAQDFSRIDLGTYRAKIGKVESQQSKKGNPMIVPTFLLTVNNMEREVESFLVITGKGAMGFDKLLRAAGFGELADKYRDASVQPKPPFDTDALVGKVVNVVIDHQMYEGELRHTISTYLPA